MTSRWSELDLELGDGRTIRAYDADPGRDALAVLWHHGTPNIGLPPEPLFEASDRLGIRWVSYDRPGYGGSTRRPGRDLAAAADDAAAVVDALGIDRFALMGHSGGASHALAVSARMPERIVGTVSVSGLAPYGADALDWFGGMADAGVASLRAALAGREEKERYEASAPDADPGFTAADLDALAAEWGWLGRVAGPALAGGPGGLVDDDLAYVAPWTFDPSEIAVPTLILHGGRDRIVPPAHAEWLVRHIPGAELWLRPDDGHISVLRSAPAALEWLAALGR